MIRPSEQLIRAMVQAIVEEVAPQRVYLFGSLARDSSRGGSDVDLLVVEEQGFGPDRSRWSELKRIRRSLRSFRLPKDILVYSRDEFEKWADCVNHVIAHAVREGRLLYERS